MIKQPAARPNIGPAVGLAFVCGIALLAGSLIAAFAAGLVGATLADSLNLGGDSDAFGDGADGFVVGAFIGFLVSYFAGGVLVALAVARQHGVRLIVPLVAVFAPTVCLLVLLAAAL
jgi:hypothetical protein